MSIQSMIFALAVGSFAAGCVAEDSTAAETSTAAELGSPWSCQNVPSGCACSGGISIIPVINVNVLTGSVLSGNDVEVLENSLNDLSIELEDVLNFNNILNGVEVDVLNKFNNVFNIPITGNDVNVCALAVLGGLICK